MPDNAISEPKQAPFKKKYRRKINGILLLDKGSGLTSNAALQQVKHLFNAKKAGHTGSLDPLATGMLPICFGEATKFSQFLLEADKHYIVVAKLGEKTTTGDAEGEVLETKHVPEISQQQLVEVLEKFKGNIEQIPSMYSALKHKGQPLYKLARQGIEVERKARPVHIYQLELLDQKPDSLTLDVRCSKGTYVRTLIEDIGTALGCGAHVVYLRRLSVAPYPEKDMITLQALESVESAEQMDQWLLPMDSAVANLPLVQVSSSAAFYLQQGQAVMVPNRPDMGYLRLMAEDGTFIGVGEVQEDGKVAPKRLLNKG